MWTAAWLQAYLLHGLGLNVVAASAQMNALMWSLQSQFHRWIKENVQLTGWQRDSIITWTKGERICAVFKSDGANFRGNDLDLWTFEDGQCFHSRGQFRANAWQIDWLDKTRIPLDRMRREILDFLQKP